MAIPTKQAKHTVDFLYKMILRHGFPEEIITNQGREFCNQIMNTPEEMTGFRHLVTIDEQYSESSTAEDGQ